jgi:assimilatory nitrate reductase catalytic subunit
VAPPAEARSDFDIFLAFGDVLGVREDIFPGWSKPADAFEEWKRVSTGRLCDYSGLTYKAIEQHGGIQWPFPAGSTAPRQTSRLYSDGRFTTDDEKARLIPAQWEPFREQPDAEFPFVLNTGRTVEHWQTRTKTWKVPILERLSPNAWLEMNPRDARNLKLKPNDRVEVVSRRGRIRGLELRVTETVAAGQVFAPFHYAEANANAVTLSEFDPISREPNYKQSAVRVEKASAGGAR